MYCPWRGLKGVRGVQWGIMWYRIEGGSPDRRNVPVYVPLA